MPKQPDSQKQPQGRNTQITGDEKPLLKDEERSYLDRTTDQVRAILGDKKAARRRARDLKRLSRGGGTYKGTYDQASLRGFKYGRPEGDDQT